MGKRLSEFAVNLNQRNIMGFVVGWIGNSPIVASNIINYLLLHLIRIGIPSQSVKESVKWNFAPIVLNYPVIDLHHCGIRKIHRIVPTGNQWGIVPHL